MPEERTATTQGSKSQVRGEENYSRRGGVARQTQVRGSSLCLKQQSDSKYMTHREKAVSCRRIIREY